MIDKLLAALDRERRDVHLEHGTRGAYMAGCKCRLCRRAQADWMREYRRRRVA